MIKPLTFLCFGVFLVWAHWDRFSHAYLEDDMVWLIPWIAQLMEEGSFFGFIKAVHSWELTLPDGMFFIALKNAFGYNFVFYRMTTFAFQLINTALFYYLLRKQIGLKPWTSYTASFIHFIFYGHFHGYIWSLTAHHLFVVFFTYLMFIVYLKADALIEQEKSFKKYYWIAFVCAVFASIQRISILMVPLCMMAHILFTTKDNKMIVKKYGYWMPHMFVLTAYQLIALTFGGYGDIISWFVKPFTGIFVNKQSIVAATATVLVFGAALLLFRWILKKTLENKPDDYFYPKLRVLSYILLLAQKAFFLSLFVFLWPIQSALFDEVILRFQRIDMPPINTLSVVVFLLSSVVLINFIHYMCRHNRHLILFIPWYLAISLYLRMDEAFIYSRYLVYISPLLSVALALFIFETLPDLMKNKKPYIIGAVSLLLLVSFVNVLAIKIRSARTLLVDYHWSYDYIKQAHLIKQDVEALSGDGDNSEPPLCIKPVTYTFPIRDPFKVTLSSVFGRDLKNVLINNDCPSGYISYETGTTVTKNGQEAVEPFYREFAKAQEALRRGDGEGAHQHLHRAIEAKPFLIQFAVDSVVPKRFFRNLILSSVTDTIHQIPALYFDGDSRFNSIDRMILSDAKNYGIALVLLSYLENDLFLFHKGTMYLTEHDVDDYTVDLFPSRREVERFKRFVQHNQDRGAFKESQYVGTVSETFRGYDILAYNEHYFGLPVNREGRLRIDAYKRDGEKYGFASKLKYKVRESVLQESKGGISGHAMDKDIVYKGHTITRVGDFYSYAPDGQDGAPFESRSLAEIRLIIDTLQSFSNTRRESVLQNTAQYHKGDEVQDLHFKVTSMNIPIGYMDVNLGNVVEDDRHMHQSLMSIRPLRFLQNISGDSIGRELTAVFDPGSFLPSYVDEIDVYKKKRGKNPRETIFHRSALYVEKRGTEEDIKDDERDIISGLFWLMSRDYDTVEAVKTPIITRRNNYLAVGKAIKKDNGPGNEQASGLVYLHVRMIRYEGEFEVKENIPVEMVLVKKGHKNYLPLMISTKTGFFPVKMALY